MKKRNIVLYVIVFLIYIFLTDFFGLLDFSLFVPGEIYDYIFVLIILFLLFFKLKKFNYLLKKNVIYLLPFLILLIGYIIFIPVLSTNGEQDLMESLSVTREILYPLIFLLFLSCDYNDKQMIKFLINLDLISIFIYLIEMFLGPITGNLHTQGLYQTLAGIKVWRSWSNIPFFSFYFIPIFFSSLLSGDYIFCKKKDIFVLIVYVFGIIIRLSRGELFAIIIEMILVILINFRNNKFKIYGKHFLLFLASVILIIIFMTVFSGVANRIIDGIKDVFSNDENSTFYVRNNAMINRYNYLQKIGKILFGIGPISRNSSIVIDMYDPVNYGVLASDIAYGTMIVRSGMVGVVLFLVSFLILSFKNLKCKRKYNYCFAIFIIGMLISAYTGNDYIYKAGSFKYGMILGLFLKSSILEEGANRG